jgi:hypothetical protein
MRNSNVDSSSMLSHIVIGLTVIIFYKLVKHFKLSEKFKYMNTNNGNTYENFYSDTVSQSINDFISNNNINIITSEQAAALSPSDLTAYNNNITTLIDNINQLKQQMQSPQVANQITPENLNTLDLSAQQQYQMFQINYLQDQIKKSQDTINAKTVASSSQNYKPIKIFSSCVVSNTNGTTIVASGSIGSLSLAGFIAVGQGTSNSIASSTDGTTWAARGGYTGLFDFSTGIAYGNNLWVAVGSGTSHSVATSTDGINWSGKGITIFSSSGTGIAYNGSNLWVAVGSGTTNTVATSPDGFTWTGKGSTIFQDAGLPTVLKRGR